MIISSEKFGFVNNSDCTENLIELFERLKNINEEVTVEFEKGTYYIDGEKCKRVYRAITNTAARSEHKNPKEANFHRTPFLFENVRNLVFDGNGSEFVIDGKVTNTIISGCENIAFKNFTLKTVNPNLHKFTVKKSSLFRTVFTLNSESRYIKENGKYYFDGKGYRYGFTENSVIAWWTIHGNFTDNENYVLRGRHPFSGAVKIKETGDHEFSAFYLRPKKYKKDETFHVYDCVRSDVGIFVEDSKNIIFENVTQNFNYSLAFVAQKCENITIERCNFVPDKNGGLDIASLADFIQICMCKGKIIVRDCNFDGAGDDTINVHGMHFKVENVKGRTFNAVFGHPQTWGFNPFSPDDEIEFTDPKTLQCKDKAKISSAELISEQEIKITVDKEIPAEYEKYVIEDVTLCPELEYTGNTIKRIVTRGMLYTSRGKCLIKNNRFYATGMSGVLFSDDASSWYESGKCADVTIENNTFDETGKNAILILPENKAYAGTVHGNFRIINNKFKKYDGECISIKATDNVEIKGNSFANEDRIKLTDCKGIQCDF